MILVTSLGVCVCTCACTCYILRNETHLTNSVRTFLGHENVLSGPHFFKGLYEG